MAEWDIPNWITLIVEVIVAVFAVIISWKFYNKGKEQQKKIQEIETEQSNLIKEMKPIIEKQGKIIEGQDIRERVRRANLFGEIVYELAEIKPPIERLKHAIDEDEVPNYDDIQRVIESCKICYNEINKSNRELMSTGVHAPLELLEARSDIST